MNPPRRSLAILAALALTAAAGEALAQDEGALGSTRSGDTPLPPSEFLREDLYRGRLENVGYGPLRLASQSPFQSLRFAVPASAPSTLPRGRWEVRETTAWSKIWGQSADYLLNFELLTTTHSVQYGVGDDTQVELGVVQGTRFGGNLDGFIRGFHDVFGIAQDGRDSFPRGSYRFELKGKGAAPVAVPEDRTQSSVEYLYFSVHQTLTGGSDLVPAVSMSLSVKGDLQGSEDLSGSGIEVAASLSLAKRWGDFYAYLTVGMAQFGDETFHGIDLRPTGLTVLAALEWNVLDGVSLVLQQLRSQGALKNYGTLSEASTEISFGLKVEAGPGVLIEMGLIENIIVFDNSPDFGLHFGLNIRL